MSHTEVAKRIVTINEKLLLPLNKRERQSLVSEQRTLWEAQFPGIGYEHISLLAH